MTTLFKGLNRFPFIPPQMTGRSRFMCHELLQQNTQIELSSSTLSALSKSVVYICWYSATIQSDIPSASRYVWAIGQTVTYSIA